MANEIGIRLSVDGEAKFKSAMKNAAKAVNDVDSRLKLATAEFKKNGDAQKLMQTRSKTLNEEIKRQTQIVDALEDALKTVEKQYGENSSQALAYEAQLNRAKQKLVQMETALDNNAKGLDENGKAFDSAGEKAEKAAISFTDLNHAITNVQNAAKNAASYVINFAKSAWNAMSGASDYADSLLTLQTQTGLSVEQLQKYAMAAGLVDTEAAAIYTAIARMVNPTGEMATALEQLGVNTREIIGTQNFSGAMKNYVKDTDLADTKARNALDVFWDTIDALKALSDRGQDVDELTKSIFGKSFAEMKPLIEAGRKGWEEAGEALNNVAGEDAIKKLGEFNDALVELQNEFQGLKTEVLGELAPGFTTIAKALTKLLERFGEWAKSEEGKAALKNLSDSIAGIVSGLGEEDFESLITTATDIIGKLASAINSITNDPSGIINGVKAALIGYAGLTVSKEVLSLLTLLRSLGGAGVAGNIGSALGNIKNMFSDGGSESTTPKQTSSGGGLGLLGYVKGVLLTAASVKGLDYVWENVFGQRSGVKNVGYALGLYDYQEHSATGEEIAAEIANAIAEGLSASEFTAQRYGTPLLGEVYEQRTGNLARLQSEGYKVNVQKSMENLYRELESTLETYHTQMIEGIQETTEEAASETVTDFGTQLTEQVTEQEMSWFDVFTNSGASAGGAFAAGLASSIPSIAGAVSRINAVVAQIQAGPATTTAYGLGLGKTGASVTRNNNIYINNLNQSNAADIYDTLRNMNSAQETMNRGYGYVPVLT